MSGKRYNRNIRVCAENQWDVNGFNILLDCSGQKEYLMFHRHNGLLFGLLKDGIAVDDLRRWRPADWNGCTSSRIEKRNSSKIYGMVGHLLCVIDEYMVEKEAC